MFKQRELGQSDLGLRCALSRGAKRQRPSNEALYFTFWKRNVGPGLTNAAFIMHNTVLNDVHVYLGIFKSCASRV